MNLSHSSPSPAHGAPVHTFACGWNAACDGGAFDKQESADWKLGWRAAIALKPRQRDRYRFNAPVKPFRYWQ